MPRNEEKKAFMGIGRLCVVLVIALLLAWFLLPVFRGIVNIGNAAGILLCSFALWLAGYPGAAGCLSSLWGHPGGKVLLSAASLALGVFLVFGAVMSCLMAAAIHRPPKENGTVVILGCQVKGTQPSLMLTKRLEAAKGIFGPKSGGGVHTIWGKRQRGIGQRGPDHEGLAGRARDRRKPHLSGGSKQRYGGEYQKLQGNHG